MQGKTEIILILHRTYELVVDGYERVVWGESPRTALPVHKQSLQFPIHHVLFHLHSSQSINL